MIKPVMGIQLYTLRDFCKTAEDFDSTLKRLSEMGVEYVQISGIGDIPAEEQKKSLDKYSMKVCVTHKSYERMNEDLDNLISEHKIIECDALGLGSAPSENRGGSSRVREFITKTDEIGLKLKAEGMTFNYHNHSFEFAILDDMNKNMMDLLIEETNPEYFHFIPDVAWIHHAGYNPVEILERIKGRVKVLHFKDYIYDENNKRKFVSLGQGRVNLEECYKAAQELDIPYIMYEQDCDWVDGDAFKATEESWEFMKSLQR